MRVSQNTVSTRVFTRKALIPGLKLRYVRLSPLIIAVGPAYSKHQPLFGNTLILAYSKSLVVRNSSKEPESGPSPEDTNYPRKSLRNVIEINDFLRNSRPLEKSRVFLR